MFEKLLLFIILIVLFFGCSPLKKGPVSLEDCGDCATELNEALEHMDNN